MSGGHFDYRQWGMKEIAETIEKDIARALKPKPEMVHEDYWTIYEMRSPGSYHSYCNYRKFRTYEEAEAYLMRFEYAEKAKAEYISDDLFCEGVIFEAIGRCMVVKDGEKQLPVLFSIQHCVYDHYPYDEDVVELTDESIETMKETWRRLRIAEIYATRVDWMMSGDDGEDTMQERLAEDLAAFEDEWRNKDWGLLYEDED